MSAVRPLACKGGGRTRRICGCTGKGSAGCSVNDRESPWVTLLTGTWRARPGRPAAGHRRAPPGRQGRGERPALRRARRTRQGPGLKTHRKLSPDRRDDVLCSVMVDTRAPTRCLTRASCAWVSAGRHDRSVSGRSGRISDSLSGKAYRAAGERGPLPRNRRVTAPPEPRRCLGHARR
jgi:hypothetical protein